MFVTTPSPQFVGRTIWLVAEKDGAKYWGLIGEVTAFTKSISPHA